MLTISHYIYLTREERYQLFNQTSVVTIGVSVPVWFNKGTTSEPANEVFCKYVIMNDKSSKNILQTHEGYNINLPKKFSNFKIEEKSVIRLLDAEDGGCEEMIFKQYSKVIRNNKSYNAVHFVEIKPIELLFSTLVKTSPF